MSKSRPESSPPPPLYFRAAFDVHRYKISQGRQMQQAQATIHTTSCSRYVIVAPEQGINHQVCRSLREAYDVLRSKRITTAEMAQRVVFDEMIGQPADETVTYSVINVPGN